MSDFTVIKYFGEREGHNCGYCSGDTSNISHGMIAYVLHPEDYKDLIDRGWMRSGKYVYKPTYGKSCCAQYTIRSHAQSFAPTKSQKKVLKKFMAYLRNGKRPPTSSMESNEESSTHPSVNDSAMPDPNRPLPQKAKDIRILNKLSKKASTAFPKPASSSTQNSGVKSLEDFIHEIQSIPNPAHTFSTRLVFRKYQMNIHNYPPDACTMNHMCCFLCQSSLVINEGYGAYHLQYLLDGKIFCVGVVDILPDAVSSDYLYYDPEYSFLSPGTLSALWELGLIRFYYMGFYVHTCPKMRYKGRFSGSQLLCLETFTWFPLEDSLPRLEISKYSRFNPDPEAVDEDLPGDLGKMLVLFRGEAMTMRTILDRKFIQRNGDAADYAKLVGSKLMKRMLLYRESDRDDEATS
ncbi:Arginyl-tRNA--protein transferase 1 [Caligus rogercresseyi]|uniref:Arginyl-tRNA--protein transferase 1 n=1 Tax=Caligus rogercresseyi TaxID=217165 RepID=A0A7T8JWG4_CALRO|nr:Arginyl-tRNA--protein transferase 1 [Caligus rogercresseyi]